MKPEDIEQMKADQEAGAKGPWASKAKANLCQEVIDERGAVIAITAHRGKIGAPERAANARRIARVPTLEAEVLRLREAAAELADAFDDGLCNAGTPGFDGNRIHRAADAVRSILAGESP